jgi:hypothetical protein
MRHVSVLLALILAVAIVAYILLSPAYLGDYRWLVIALPISLAIAREIYEHTKGQRFLSHPPRIEGIAIEPVDEDRQAAGLDDQTPTGVDISGLWTGTVNIWPRNPNQCLQVLPLRLLFSGETRQAAILTNGPVQEAPRIIQANVIAYDPQAADLDLQLLLEQPGGHRILEARLTLKDNRLVPAEPADDVTVELRPAIAVAVVA